MQDFFHPQYVCTVDRTRGYISTIQRGEGFVPQCCSIHGLHHIQQYKLVKPPLAFIHKLLSPSDPNQLTFHLHFIWRSIWQIFWYSTHYLYIYIYVYWLIDWLWFLYHTYLAFYLTFAIGHSVLYVTYILSFHIAPPTHWLQHIMLIWKMHCKY